MTTSVNILNKAACGLLVLALGAFVAPATLAQQADDEDGQEPIDEIIVTPARRPDDTVDLNALYEEELKARLMRDLEVIKQQEAEGRWSKSDIDLEETPSRISWGYDPEASARMRRDTDFMEPQRDTVQPASLFRVEF